ncbi:hypothetical protein ACLKA6_015234 [Drosophila palustris]
MAKEVITTDQLKYYRLVSNNDQRSKDRWTKCFSWYPGRQKIEFSRIPQIYCDSRHRYGDEVFMKYARSKRLNNKHTITISPVDAANTLENDQDEKWVNVNSDAKVPATTNGEYGRFKPNRMHYC